MGSFSLTQAREYIIRTPSDSAPKDFTTIQDCAQAAQPGDSCLVQAGDYPEHVRTIRGGSSSNSSACNPLSGTYPNTTVVRSECAAQRITFKAIGLVTMNGFDIRHSYVTVDGFDISRYAIGSQGHITVNAPGSYCRILNNTIRDGAPSVYGIFFELVGTNQFPSHCTVSGNTLYNLRNHYLSTQGVGHLFENNTFKDLGGWDPIYLFGHGHLFRRNIFRTGVPISGQGNHPDFVQTFSDGGGESYNMIFEENFIHDLLESSNRSTGYQLGQMNNGGGIFNPTLSPNFHDFMFRRNVFANVASNMNAGVPGLHFINNTFYRLAFAGNGLVYSGSLVTSDASRGLLKNNAFISGGIDPNNGMLGYYSLGGAELSKDALMTLVTREDENANPKYQCRGNCPIANGILADLVAKNYTNWNGAPLARAKSLTRIQDFELDAQYSSYKSTLYNKLIETVNLDNSIRNSFVADYNFVSPVKDTDGFIDRNGINGGDPLFLNAADPDGPNNNLHFSPLAGLKPRPGSPLCGNGEGGTDIGAYSCDPSEVFTDPSSHLLTVTKQGAGTVTSVPAGIDCGNDCSATLNTGAWITLTATPDLGGVFTGWSGACSGTDPCTLTTTGPASVTALFSSQSAYCASPSVHCVDDTAGATQEYANIQACAGAVQSGEVCLVFPGNYPEHVETLRGHVTFRALNNAQNPTTTLAQRTTMKGFRIKHPSVTIEGFDITKYDVGLDQGHIVVEPEADNSLITNNVIRDGIYLSSLDFRFDGPSKTITNPAGGFVAAGFIPGVTLYIACNINRQILNHDNNSANPYRYETKTIQAVTDTTLTLDPSNTVFTEGPVSATIYANKAEKNGVWGIQFLSYSGRGQPNNCIIRGNRFSNLAGKGVQIHGSNNLIERNTWERMNGWRMMAFFGNNNIFRYNVFKDSPRWPDFELPLPGTVFSLGSGSWDMYDTLMTSTGAPDQEVNNNVFEYNFIKDIDEQFASVEATASGISALPNRGLTVRNNVFIGLEMIGSFSRPETKMINNTFYKSAWRSAHNFVIGQGGHGNPVGSFIKNNAFVESGQPAVPTSGWYSTQGDDHLPTPGVTADYNFVTGSAVAGYPAKTGFQAFGLETHGLNGGDPKFKISTNLSDGILGADGIPFTPDDGLKPEPGSLLLCGRGEGGIDIGAYSCNPNTVFAGLTAPPPLDGGGTGSRKDKESSFLPFKNVFNPSRGEKLIIKYKLSKPNVLKILTSRGEKIFEAHLDSSPAAQEISWDGKVRNQSVASGVYLLLLGNEKARVVVVK